MIKQDILENLANVVYLGIGSNLGNKRLNIELTKNEINNSKIKILKSSSLYETKSWPDSSKPKFINIILKIRTSLPPLKLINYLQAVEIKLGRVKSKKNAPRICDIDIIDYNHQILLGQNKYNLILPHPAMTKRNFVLIPLFEISKNWKHPQNGANIVDLINLLKTEDLRSIKLI